VPMPTISGIAASTLVEDESVSTRTALEARRNILSLTRRTRRRKRMSRSSIETVWTRSTNKRLSISSLATYRTRADDSWPNRRSSDRMTLMYTGSAEPDTDAEVQAEYPR